jgi:hypothetical protein
MATSLPDKMPLLGKQLLHRHVEDLSKEFELLARCGTAEHFDIGQDSRRMLMQPSRCGLNG